MSFDGFFTHAIVHELDQKLTTGRVAKVSQPYPAELIITIRAHRKNYPLLLSANPTYPRVQITDIPYKNPAVPTNFTMTMRKYLEGAIVNKIEQVDNDRIIKIIFDTRDELGDTQQLILIIEIMARHSNISLVNHKTGKIIDTIKHVGSDQNRVRLLLPGATFVMPPKQDKVNPYLPNQVYSDLVRQAEDLQDLARTLQQHYQGLGKDSAQELAQELLQSDNLPTTYQQFLNHFNNPTPVIIKQANGKTQFAAFSPIDASEATLQHFDSVSALLDAFYANKAEQDRSKELAGQVLKVIKNELKKDRRKVKKLQQQLKDAATANEYRVRGEILTTYLSKLTPGMKEIELPNFYNDNQPLKIKLSPELSPSRNAQKYFTKYNKLKTSVEYVNEQLKLTNDEIQYFENIESQIKLAAPADIQEIKLELQDQGYIKKKKSGKKQRKVKPSAPDEFHTSDGTLVLVGKNNRQNDRLSFKIANKNEIWLHVKDIPGSHVVIRSTNPSDKTILEAAELAAYFSKGRDSDNVPVDYLPVKQLHKPNGAKPGFVIFRGQKTLYVTPHKLGK
ncbi:NFACT family protein [Limosilactobacillus sp. STM2_1]|uniref:Rqc2 homolog RqcH n=1 Tax=Limosilactobacillus rudii TaxID=2759755 RepID=A0A7W3UJJ4_9LACO|nr:NFACT RNA binding domain-containing protein [Limosilactobacillus rudii]MBB1078654.1 NFACT family protein [Limosilactobacillus rudii]MBB1096778.1 NFACT family protein [Limosilactobacillus rudii]MCD7135550.1 NFACT family protein [Limosilactobacillus rudii]